MVSPTHTVVVVVIALGAAALYWVARKQENVSVLGIEQYDLFHHRGGSQDHSRIIRLAQSSPAYTKIAAHMYMVSQPRTAISATWDKRAHHRRWPGVEGRRG